MNNVHYESDGEDPKAGNQRRKKKQMSSTKGSIEISKQGTLSNRIRRSTATEVINSNKA